MFMTPFDMVKQRMQLGFHKSVVDCVRSVVRAEGLRALYVSLPTTLAMNIPYGIVMVPVNESVKKLLNPSNNYSFSASMIAGCFAGGIAAACTNPLDVVKTRLQTQGLEACPVAVKVTKVPSSSGIAAVDAVLPSMKVGAVETAAEFTASTARSSLAQLLASPFRGMVDTSRRILAEEGCRGFLRGVVPRVMVQAPAVAISWTAYESMKQLLASGASAAGRKEL